MVFYAQSTSAVISGQRERSKLVFTPSQPVWLYQGEREKEREITGLMRISSATQHNHVKQAV